MIVLKWMNEGAPHLKYGDLLHFYRDCTMASLTNSDVYLVYCEVDMPMNSDEDPINSVVQYLVCSEAHRKVDSFP